MAVVVESREEGAMKKVLVILLAIAVLGGCASTPMSSVYDGAKPSHVIQNGDGTTTFEFVFPYGGWDQDMAKQRINEYLTNLCEPERILRVRHSQRQSRMV